jgi:HSP20 family molecular chaperone IbpA
MKPNYQYFSRTLSKTISRPRYLNNISNTIRARPVSTNNDSNNTMTSLLARPFYNTETSFTPLFRLLDDFDSYSREGHPGQELRRFSRTLTPSFDVCETDDAYKLHGELPGIGKENVDISFTEPQTMVIKGKVERSYAAGTPPAGLPGTSTAGLVEEGDTGKKEGKAAKEKGEEKSQQAEAAPKEKFWISERSFGEFSRNFSFPQRVDTDHVSAHLENGILDVTVPKLQDRPPQRIDIH